MTKKVVKIRQLAVEDETSGSDIVVKVIFEMIPLEDKWVSGNPAKGRFVCYYPVPAAAPGRPKASRARAMVMNGTPLSKEQVENLNTMISLVGRGR